MAHAARMASQQTFKALYDGDFLGSQGPNEAENLEKSPRNGCLKAHFGFYETRYTLTPSGSRPERGGSDLRSAARSSPQSQLCDKTRKKQPEERRKTQKIQ